MTQAQKQTIEQALARAAKEGIRIIGRGQMNTGARFWLVSSKNYQATNRAYIVTCTGSALSCNCRATGICKHRAVVHQELKAEAERKDAQAAPAAEAAGDCWGDYQTSRLDTAIYVPVATRAQANRYGDDPDYIPGDYYSHAYR